MDTSHGIATGILETINIHFLILQAPLVHHFLWMNPQLMRRLVVMFVFVWICIYHRVFNEIMVEMDEFVFMLLVIYERLPDFCFNCKAIGHNIAACK
jgi:hypothetical protein